MIVPNIGIHETHRAAAAQLLHVLLADEILLALKTRNFQWNVTGPGAQECQSLFDLQYNSLNMLSDALATRIRALGFKVDGQMHHFLEICQVKDQSVTESTQVMAQTLLHDHELIIRHIRDHVPTIEMEYKDAGTARLLVSNMEGHEKMAWKLRTYLEN